MGIVDGRILHMTLFELKGTVEQLSMVAETIKGQILTKVDERKNKK